ncbi:MAG: tetratricopeptide repeat protein [Ignavibacteriales bacterium]|nr:tetratricopeptide repeat protein [Ignavibacteriales bacterium]
MKNLAAFLGIFGLTLFFSGCFVYNPTADFVKQRYTNSISYFNTFYNAQRAFDEAEEEVIAAQKEFREKPVPGRQFSVPSTARTKFTSSIEKNSKVLSFYPTSKWVDDALLMIGKAYFYLEDNVRAERKFLELSVKFPESDLIDESTLFLGRSFLRQKKITEGVKRLEELLEKTIATDENIAGMAAYELGQFYLSQNNFELAEKFYSQSLPMVDDEEQQAHTQFQIAQCLENLKLYEKAEAEYEKVSDYEPGYTLLFSADLAKARTLVQREKFSEAVEMMESMLEDTKNTEFYASIHFEIANALLAQGDRIGAMEKYRYIDTTFVRTDESAKSYFALAQIYERVDRRYDSARVYYGKAKSEFPSSKITQEASQKFEVFTKYDTYNKDLIRFDSLIAQTKRQREKDDSVRTAASDSVSLQLKDSTITEIIDPKSRKATKPVKKGEAKKDSIPPFDSTKIKAQIAKDLAFKQLLDSLQRSIIRTKFELGGLFFLELPVPDSALYWFDQVVMNYPQSEFAPRALYTIAEIYRTIKERPQAVRDSIHSLIISSYPSSPYAQESRKILGIPIVEIQKDTVIELLDRAEAFADANDFIGAIKTYKEVVEKHSSSPLTPKAMFTAGWHYENSIRNPDSALAVYRRLIARYPSSQYATVVRPKITEYDNEQKRIEQEKQKLIEEEKLKEQKEKEMKESALKPRTAQQDSMHIPQTIQPDSLVKPHTVKPDTLSATPREKI